MTFFVSLSNFELLFWLNDLSFWLFTFLFDISFFFLFCWFLYSHWRSFNRYLFFFCPLLDEIDILQLGNIMNIIAYSHSEPEFVQSLIFIKFGFRNFIRSNVFRNSFKKLCSVWIVNHQIQSTKLILKSYRFNRRERTSYFE